MTKGDVAREIQLHVWCGGGIPVATLLELLPEYPAIDGCSRASVICHSLAVHEALFVNDFPAFVDHVLLVNAEQGGQGFRDTEDSVPGDD